MNHELLIQCSPESKQVELAVIAQHSVDERDNPIWYGWYYGYCGGGTYVAQFFKLDMDNQANGRAFKTSFSGCSWEGEDAGGMDFEEEVDAQDTAILTELEKELLEWVSYDEDDLTYEVREERLHEFTTSNNARSSRYVVDRIDHELLTDHLSPRWKLNARF